MSFATFWSEDTLTPIGSLPGVTAGPTSDWDELAEINHISRAEVIDRINNGHRPYVARMDGQPVAYGWLATRKISIGELDINVELPPDDRYLWDFATLPDWQGRGLYPRLLQAILEQEIQNAKRFWIIHAPENLPSGAGMSKAGFEFVGQLSFTADGKVGLAPYSDSTERARIGADLLQVPLIESVLAPCWSCGEMVAKHPDKADANSCWPPQRSNGSTCCCKKEVKKSNNVIIGV
ncbi:MAG TPA: GNAT family N-acetyltransferase [Anaerolineales bacterium]|nr:GNAT family N-acetyltransferase [Anaerolineales bacterium]